MPAEFADILVHSPMWKEDRGKYVLRRRVIESGQVRMLVYQRGEKPSVVLFGNDQIAAMVQQLMVDSGVPIIDSLEEGFSLGYFGGC